MSLSDFKGRLPAPVTARPWRPLSNDASTASCNMRFSLRIMTSGVLSWSRFFNRLFRLIARRHVEHQPEARGYALEKPDVGDRHGQFDVAHALAAHARQCDFHPAAVANDAAVFDAFVFAARAFPIFDRAENALAQQAAFF